MTIEKVAYVCEIILRYYFVCVKLTSTTTVAATRTIKYDMRKIKVFFFLPLFLYYCFVDMDLGSDDKKTKIKKNKETSTE